MTEQEKGVFSDFLHKSNKKYINQEIVMEQIHQTVILLKKMLQSFNFP